MNLGKWLKKSLCGGILRFLPVALLASAVDAALLWGIRSFMELLSGEPPFALWQWVLIMVILSAIRLALLLGKTRISETWISNTGANVTAWFLRTLRSISPRFFHLPEGEAQVESAFEATQVLQTNGTVFFQGIQAVLQLLVFLPVLLFISWPLTLFLFVVVVPLVAWMQRKLHKLGPEEETLLFAKSKFRTDLNRARRLYKNWSSPFERAAVSSNLLESIRYLAKRGLKASIQKNGLSLMMETVSVLAMVVVLAFCALLISKGWMDAQGLVLFCSAVLLSYKPLKECARVIPQFRSAMSAYRLLLRFGDVPKKNPCKVKMGEGLQIEKGVFGYDGSAAVVFSGQNFTLNENLPVLLRGRNGAGKTTLLRLIAGLEEWNSGDMRLPSKALAAGIFMMSQDFELPPRELLRTLVEKNCAPAVLRFIEVSGAKPLLEKSGLSGGERSRMGLLWALASKAKVVLLDEPLASIALADRATILQEFLAAAAATGKWVLMSSHDALPENLESTFQVVDVEHE